MEGKTWTFHQLLQESDLTSFLTPHLGVEVVRDNAVTTDRLRNQRETVGRTKDVWMWHKVTRAPAPTLGQGPQQYHLDNGDGD